MKIFKLSLFVCSLMLTAQVYGQTILIDYSATWSYYDNANQPSDNGGFDWNDINYNASSWSQGNAQLGYGDSDENTVINSNTKTAYFRYNFNVADPSNFDGLDLELIYDDGAVVYLNGNEVWRVNMPNGTISYSTFSSTSSSDNAFASNSIANSLVTGDNVIAVEIHQSSNSSSDISFDFKATGSIPGAVNISRGPYLQKASASNITVRYRTASSTQTIIKYGTDINNLNQTYSDNNPKTEHIADISGLSPNTTYYYRIENNAAVLLPEATDIYFKTHPVIGTDQPITMWILGDCGTANNNQRNVRDAYYNYIGNNHTDGILFLGDNAYNDGTDAQYQNAIFSNMYENKLKNSVAWSCLGNHDGYSTNSNSQTGPYYDIFSFPTAGESGGVASGTEAYYSFDYGNVHFIALESYQTDRSVGGAMYNWALNDIQNTTQDWIVAYWHHPPYTKGSHDSDSEGNLIDMRQNFLPMLESNGVDLVLSGHSHSYERSYFLNGHYGNSNSFNSSTHTVGANGDGDGQQDGIGEYNKTITGANAGEGAVYITTGSSGKISGGSLNHQAMFYSVSQLGSCVLEVNGNQLDVKFVRETGAIDDYFTIVKEEACTEGASCDDGDACTENDAYDSNCNCVGTSLPDSDGDGICDTEDQCPNLDDSLIGTSCDDGDSGTENDMYGTDCICAGSPCSPAGTACNDNDPATYNDETDGNCNCAGIPCPTAGTACDDGDPSTINDVEDGFCNCSGDIISSTTCITINSGDDDVEEIEANGALYLYSSDIELVYDTYQSPGNQTVGLRFNTIDVPQGAIITNAYIQFTVDETNSGTTNLTIVGEDSDNAAPFGTTAYEITNRPKTQANVAWSPPAWVTVGAQTIDQQTPDISSIIQEIVDRPGYAINNSVALVITGTGERTAESYDGSASQAPQLCIEYSTVCQTEGNACDDGDDCTINDVIDSNCNCAGTFQDSDSDGICDADDTCDNNTTGNSCNDGDDCTINDVIDANCNCVGTFQDSDSDGICDANDQCPNLDDALIGTSCDDGDSGTENDIYGTDCICAGSPCSPAGTSCDDNDPATYNDETDGNCNCSGIPCPVAGTSCNDGDPSTINDVEDGFCNCAGELPTNTTCIFINSGDDDIEENEVNGSLYLYSTDLELVYDNYQSAGNQTIGLRFNTVDVPQGATITNAYIQFTVDETNTGTTNLTIVGEDSDNAAPFGTTAYEITNRPKTQANVAWSPPSWNSVGDQTIDQQTPDISSIIQEIVDRPGYATNNSMALVITGTGERTAESYDGSTSQAPQLCIEYSIACQTQGDSCDDGDPCTINDTIDANCNCAGTFEDSDGDGVCDASDQCPGSDDTQDADNDGIPDGCDTCDNDLIGTACNDGDVCTINDVYDVDCNCAGTFQDSDGDGVCDASDQCPGSDDTIDSDGDGVADGCDVCPGFDDNADTDSDGVADGCDVCPGFDDNEDSDGDGVADGCDACPGFDDNADSDSDGVADGCDVCPGFDDNADADSDGVADGCDVCPGFDDNADTDSDGVADGCDACPGFDDNADSDSDGVADGCDVCPGFDDNVDSDGDGVADGCDVCPGFDDNADTDSDGVADGCDVCPGFDDNVDSDSDGVADGCDVCPGFDDNADSDSDGVADGCDVCPGFDDNVDSDGDGVADGCDACPGFDDNADSDSDSVADGCDVCPGFDDSVDTDGDGIPDGCDTCDNDLIGTACNDGNACTINDVYDVDCNCAGTFQDSDGDGVCDASDQCPGSDDTIDSDGDGVADGCDVCPGFDDNADTDSDGVADGCDVCPGFDDNEDSDGDGVADGCDVCPGFDDNVDSDGDGVADGCDVCPGFDDNADADSDGVADGCDVCPGFDDNADTDSDGVADGCDVCPGFDDNVDSDSDGVADGCDVCPGFDDNVDSDGDGVADGCDVCPGFDDNADADSDGVADGCDVCPGFDDNVDTDGDSIPDGCDTCDNDLIGTACNDGNACTINDVYDVDCNCAGTFQDSDGDGVCDASDQCPGFDDNVDSDGDGVADGCDVCPGFDDNADSDSDGVADGCDVCPGFDDNVDSDGDGVADGCDACPGFDDNVDSDNDGVADGCDACPGFDDTIDSDNDGIPNGCDDCDINTVGDSCDDLNPCTINDVIDIDCNCVGVFQDSDSDGVCDAEDLCPGNDDTIDTDSDGVADGCDVCPGFDDNADADSDGIADGCDVCPGFDDNADADSDGVADGCDTCPGFDDNADADSDGVADGCDVCQGFDDSVDTDGDSIPDGCDNCNGNTIGDSCDDGDDCTINDVIDANCNCAGTFEDSDNDGICDANDNCDNTTIGDSCDDGDACTINDVIDANCNCAGTFEDSDNDGICDANDNCDNTTIGDSCDDGDACTINDVIDANCNCAGTFEDSDNDGICDANDNCDNTTIGDSCDDGDDCTINDVIDANCNCAGTFEDSDNDGICDANDNCDNTTIGDSCDDGDVCTINDVIDANCNCAGTFEDSDNDGICDANDNCDNTTIGDSCDDGDACTINDVIDANCNCAGTFEDSDNDGICDANDNCDNTTIGDSCDDGDACTINDVIDANCNCAGTFEDSDNDGICDANDNCDNTTIGDSCDDGDACTINDVIDANCNCAGTFEDSDNDGICDANDNCDNTTIGDSCDDGDACTINDVIDANCNCAGTFEDSDNDGICDANDPCPNLDNSLIGTACDDGNSGTENDVYGEDCICAGDPCDQAGTACDDEDPSTYNDSADGNCNCIGIPCPSAGTSCDDGDPTTINDIEDGFCNCAGEIISITTCVSITSGNDDVEENEVNGSIYSNSSDLELVYDSYQSAGNQTIGLRFSSVAVPQGAFIMNASIQFTVDESNTGTTNLTIVGEDEDDASAFGTTAYDVTNRQKTQANVNWSPPDWNTVGDQTIDQQTPDISSIIQEIVDRPGYVINNSMVLVLTGSGERTAESFNGSPTQAPQLCIEYSTVCLTEGNSCDDGDDCTTNDVIDANCNCAGSPLPDTDNDGVCDAEDACPGMDDNMIGQSCEDNDPCTVNEIYDENCNCTGTYQDNDNDGICIGLDPDDNDPCNPNSNSPQCSPCDDILNDGFEINYGAWNDGGGDCTRRSQYPNTGIYSVRLRDNSGEASSMTTDMLDLTAYSELTFEFSFYPNSMENGEDFFLEISTDNGSSFTIYRTWARGTDFNNGTRYDEVIVIDDIAFTSQTKLRLRCDASGNGDHIFIDDAILTGCNYSNSKQEVIIDQYGKKVIGSANMISNHFGTDIKSSDGNELENIEDNYLENDSEEDDFKVYPNPTRNFLYINGNWDDESNAVEIRSIYGQRLFNKAVEKGFGEMITIDISHLPTGIYFVNFIQSQEIITSEKVVILNN